MSINQNILDEGFYSLIEINHDKKNIFPKKRFKLPFDLLSALLG